MHHLNILQHNTLCMAPASSSGSKITVFPASLIDKAKTPIFNSEVIETALTLLSVFEDRLEQAAEEADIVYCHIMPELTMQHADNHIVLHIEYTILSDKHTIAYQKGYFTNQVCKILEEYGVECGIRVGWLHSSRYLLPLFWEPEQIKWLYPPPGNI